MTNTSIVVCGQKFDIGTRVVLWDEPSGFNAYDTSESKLVTAGLRYRYRNSKGKNLTLKELQDIVIQFFLHHSGSYRSSGTFETLQNERKLSVHFILDDDGTLYQTLDLREVAFHGSQCNQLSVGIEIDSRAGVNDYPGAYDDAHQNKYGVGPRLTYLDRGVQGHDILGYEYSDGQYQSLISLAIGLINVFPKIAESGDFMRTSDGKINKSFDANCVSHKGFLGHYNANPGKWDPIAFDHERFLNGIKNKDPMSKSTIRGASTVVTATPEAPKTDDNVSGDAFCPGNLAQCISVNLDGWTNIQNALKSLHYFEGQVDGVFGPLTKQALEDFQNDHGLSVDGVWGPKTKAKLEAVLQGKE